MAERIQAVVTGQDYAGTCIKIDGVLHWLLNLRSLFDFTSEGFQLSKEFRWLCFLSTSGDLVLAFKYNIIWESLKSQKVQNFEIGNRYLLGSTDFVIDYLCGCQYWCCWHHTISWFFFKNSSSKACHSLFNSFYTTWKFGKFLRLYLNLYIFNQNHN